MSPAKRFLVFGLSFLVLMNSAGIFAFTYLEAGLHRAAEYAEESGKKTELLSLTGDEFASVVWVGTQDFIFNGKVYDCDAISTVNGKINMKCHSDAEETNLKNSLADNFDNGSKNAPCSKPVKDFFKVFPVFQNLPVADLLITKENSSFQYSNYSKQLPESAVLALNSPPPKFS